jgi:uncharacterized damage-inducible protein DinB
MPVGLAITDLLDYTEWERQTWLEWLRSHGASALQIRVGPHGDGRFQNVGEVVRHIFSAEQRYVERLSGRPMTDPSTIPADDLEGLFQFGQGSRQALREFIETLPAEEWDILREFKLFHSRLSATPRKIVAHILLHEIRHWAQLATLWRWHGLTTDFHDFLFSPVLGGEFHRGSPTT